MRTGEEDINIMRYCCELSPNVYILLLLLLLLLLFLLLLLWL